MQVPNSFYGNACSKTKKLHPIKGMLRMIEQRHTVVGTSSGCCHTYTTTKLLRRELYCFEISAFCLQVTSTMLNRACYKFKVDHPHDST